ncbi:hypothetical protein F4781DRAFT_440873 [Annulohypoxylon bovei var. microspora]|nr:hypothetical protein F4781DRAFT_440873 [Annulohypoxylon bovei var. microspora]
MKFPSAVFMGLFAVALAQSPTSTSTDITSRSTDQPDLTTCKEQAGSYAEYCPRCEPKCAGSSAYKQCLYNVFSSINSMQSQCWQHGGNNCKETAVNKVCG